MRTNLIIKLAALAAITGAVFIYGGAPLRSI
jgi:hypothetical protein